MVIRTDQEILFSNFRYDPESYYFFYFGDIKTYYLNSFVKDILQFHAGTRKVQMIAVVPDMLNQYDYQNIIVINPSITAFRESSSAGTGSTQSNISCRIGSPVFMKAVSESIQIRNLIRLILEKQNNLYLYLFESVEEMTLDEIDGVTILGPDKVLSKELNNKIVQYQQVRGKIPTAEHYFCDDISSLLTSTSKTRKEWRDGIFISCAYSAAGSNSIVTYSQQEVEEWCHNKEGPFLVSRFMPHTLDPTVLAVVANENDVYIAGIADQIIENGNRFVGSSYPSVATREQKKLLHEYTVTVGQMLGRLGYRGIFGCDYIIADDGTLYFIEINARKQGTTLEFCYTLEQALPDGSPMLPELEYYAVTENRFPGHSVELKLTYDQIHWGTYNYKVFEEKLTTGYLPHNPYERASFHKIARGGLTNDFVVLEHVGIGFTVLPGTFLARVVSVAGNREYMEAGLRQGVGFIKHTINEA